MRGLYTPPGQTVPHAFRAQAKEGVLHIQGETVRVEPPLRRGWTFSVGDAAGLTVHQPRGRSFENVLFDAQGKALCRFVMTGRGAEVFVQYLRNHGVPFYRPDGQPLEPAASKGDREGGEDSEDGEKIRGTDLEKAFGPRFTLQLRRTEPIGVWIGCGMALGLLVFFPGFPAVAYFTYGKPYEDFALNVLMVLTVVFNIGPWVLAAVRGQLFPPQLSVEGDRLWLNGWKELRLEEVEGLRWHAADECYILVGKNGKALAKFSTRDEFGPQFMNFLTNHDFRVTKQG